MPSAARWAERRSTPGGRVFSATWAPSVARMGPGRFVSAYAVPRASDGHRCISLARATHPLGPYVDSTRRPLTCLGRNAIDPQIFRDRGAVWLLYKVAGSPDRLMVRRMTASASSFGPTSRNYTLLSTRARWEGGTVENPAMIRFNRRLYLFYSANAYETARYATGYAVAARSPDGAPGWDGCSPPAPISPARVVRRRSSIVPAACVSSTTPGEPVRWVTRATPAARAPGRLPPAADVHRHPRPGLTRQARRPAALLKRSVLPLGPARLAFPGDLPDPLRSGGA